MKLTRKCSEVSLEIKDTLLVRFLARLEVETTPRREFGEIVSTGKTTRRDAHLRICGILTMYNEHNSLADRRRHAIGRDAKISSHLQSVHFRDIEDRSLNAGHCDRWWAITRHSNHEMDTFVTAHYCQCQLAKEILRWSVAKRDIRVTTMKSSAGERSIRLSPGGFAFGSLSFFFPLLAARCLPRQRES